MEILGGIFGALLVGAMAFGWQWWRWRKWRAALKYVAHVHKVDFYEPRFVGRVSVTGKLEGMALSIKSPWFNNPMWLFRRKLFRKQSALDQNNFTVIRLETGLPGDWHIRKDTLSSVFRKAVAGDVKTGDSEFDDAVLLQGDTAAFVASLDEASRNAVATAVDYGAILSDGVFEIIKSGVSAPGAELDAWVTSLVSAASALKLQVTERKALLAQAVEDGNAGVRARALVLLWNRFRGTDEAQTAVTQTLANAGVAEPGLAPEEHYIALLNSADDGTRVACALWLAEHGTAASVMALNSAGETAASPKLIAPVVQHAVAMIQERVGDSGAGGLSLVETDSVGHLSLANVDGGLSLADVSVSEQAPNALDLSRSPNPEEIERP